MDQRQQARPPSRRAPLGEATRRVNNIPSQILYPSKEAQHESLRQDGLFQNGNHDIGHPGEDYCPSKDFQQSDSLSAIPANPRLSAISKDYPGTDSNRNSQYSTASTNASDGKRIKAMIGPWKLGKTLGKGATARVRLARHACTGQEAAIKIVQKKNAQLSQAGSLAALDKAESKILDTGDGLRRMPVGIEREVAIMKLIQHPHIMKMYDIWENRTEIYLVLEYVDNGELFKHIIKHGRLDEEEAIKCFRQILSAVGYCHSFNICHRDLKPENILLTKTGAIKIADFGMAALHQGPDHKLKTSCGSPHYAAPELVKGASYRGDKVDIWSMGVILYAALSGRLPFDVEGSGPDWLAALLKTIMKGDFDMAPEFSQEATDLIHRMLRVNPRDRITVDQIWKHPLVRRYQYLDNLGPSSELQVINTKNCGRPVLRKSEINKELLRHLRSMWHHFSEQQLMDALLSETPNEQKLFYTLLLRYRDAQLENYTPDLGYSNSDYHHARPENLSKTYSTRQFPPSRSKGHGRQTSRFTVISNTAETERSYDPYKASRPQYLASNRADDRAIITIHGTKTSTPASKPTILPTWNKQEQRGGSLASSSIRRRNQDLLRPRTLASRSSLASSTRSKQSGSYMKASVRHKRGVSFSHIRKNSGGPQVAGSSMRQKFERHSNHTEVTDDGGDSLRAVTQTPQSTRYIRSRKIQAASSQPLLSIPKPGRASHLWSEDVRQLSTSLAKDCDEAFNGSVPSKDRRKRDSIDSASSNDKACPVQPTEERHVPRLRKKAFFDNRPLPPPPERSDSVQIELMEAKTKAEMRMRNGGDGSPRYLDRMVSHIDRLIQPSSPAISKTDRRALSAPVEPKRNISARPLPSIFEANREDGVFCHTTGYDSFTDHQERNGAGQNSRVASAPEPRSTNNRANNIYTRADPWGPDSIRVVTPSASQSPVRPPAPLTIRKKSSLGGPSVSLGRADGTDKDGTVVRKYRSGLELRDQFLSSAKTDCGSELTRIDEDEQNLANVSNGGSIGKKKSSWFKRNSKSSDEQEYRMSVGGVNTTQVTSIDTARPNHDQAAVPPLSKKKFSLGRLFKRRTSQPDMAMSADDIFDDTHSILDSIAEGQRLSHGRQGSYYQDPAARQIEPQRNWLAKLFNVKPASRYICFAVTKRRARQEITTILKEWKRYGIKDVQIDKERNIVFGKVAAKNYLDLKEVAFAGEVMTVIEHGKRSRLSIARFTQERGAASSFIKVIETLENVLKVRGMLVGDERKARMMVKTLRSA